MSTPIKTYMPISQQLTDTNGLVTQTWFRFFQTIATSSDQTILANIPLLRTQVNAMLIDIATLNTEMLQVQQDNTRQDDELNMALIPLPTPQKNTHEELLEITNDADRALLAQRINDIENWSL